MSHLKVLLFGATGQVGIEAAKRAASHNVDLLAVDRTVADLEEPGAAAELISETNCDAVINAAAYTAVDQAETNYELAHKINGLAPAEMASACKSAGVPFVHFSTDYVFLGKAKTPYLETDACDPTGVYASTKHQGERGVLEAEGVSAILRLSWVFSSHGSNFVKTMLRVGQQHGAVRVVGDQIGKPTPAGSAADAAFTVVRALSSDSSLSGVYHFAGDKAVSWAEFAAAIFETAGLDVNVTPITTADYPTPAKRPAWSVLDTRKFEQAFKMPAPDWRAELERIVPALLARQNT